MSDSDENIPLSKIRKGKYKRKRKEMLKDESDLSDIPFSECDDSDKDPDFIGLCEHYGCANEIVESCNKCDKLLCVKHLTKHEPCSKPVKKLKKTKTGKEHTSSAQSSTTKTTKITETSLATHHHQQSCEIFNCNDEVFAACDMCLMLLCWHHFDEYENCDNHYSVPRQNMDTHVENRREVPEDFPVHGGEAIHKPPKSPRKNKKQIAKSLRTSGKEYKSPKTNKIIPQRNPKPKCNTSTCQKFGKECNKIDDEARLQICLSFYDLGSLQLQREYITRHVQTCETKQKTTAGVSRRSKSNQYFLTYNYEKILVCKTFFQNTLDISERSVRTALSKITSTGTVEEDKRGGRKSQHLIDQDKTKNKLADDHINRFPFVESHYCRASSSKNYLHHGLSVPRMYKMFIQEHGHLPKEKLPSFSLYRKVFSKKNLSFHTPKKDQCSLCATYLTGNDTVKAENKERYEKHIEQKNRVRELKTQSKFKSKNDPTHLTAVFDLQQVIHLPLTQESAVFYKRRLAVYNLTVYDIGTKDAFCYTWDETQSKRGSSEIATALFKFLNVYDDRGIKTVTLFSDGCPGQNKNSIIPTMLLYFVATSKSITEITMNYFEPYHGQNEGDSCHSAINYAVKKTGDVFVPSQLHTIFKLARRENPYSVVPLQANDMLDFKSLSVNMRVLKERDTKTGDEAVDWTKMVAFFVSKYEEKTISFKTNHMQKDYRRIELKRQQTKISEIPIDPLNSGPLPIPNLKYRDLVSLCSGPTPVIRLEEHKVYYKNLVHL